jgi:hypothetical protein
MKTADIGYIMETESYLEQNKETMPKNVYGFIKQVCFDEKRYIDLVEKMSQEKGIFKVPEVKAAKY